MWSAMGNSVRSAVCLIGLVVLTFVAAGCSKETSAGYQGGPTEGTSTQSATASTAAPLSEANVDRKTRRPDPNATAYTLPVVSVMREADHDRVIFEFTGAAVPGWAVQYVSAAVQNGTGAPLELPGLSKLEILFLESPGPFTNPAPYTGPPVVFDNDTPQVNTVEFSAQGSGIIQFFVTLNGDRPPFAVTSLTNPTRIVVDVAD